jgi:hypothetical protein
MRVVISGASGLIGTAVSSALRARGEEVVALTRSARGPAGAIHWNPEAGTIDARQLEGCDAIVHLAGESIAKGRWTTSKKARIRDSRVRGTTLVAQTVATLAQKPRCVVCASAIGYYGDRGNESLDEASPPGKGFLAEVCQEWEAAAKPIADANVRLVNTRIGVVLSARGGALTKMLTPFKLCLGGVLGSGKQQMSWIDLDDLARIVLFALDAVACSGPVNAVAPEVVSNREFTKTLGKVLGRPTPFPAPAAALRLLLGEMADELLLSSARVEPTKLGHLNFSFLYPTLEASLRHQLGR